MSRRLHGIGALVTGVIGGGGVVTYTISGTVYDADGTTAVASATVALGALSATSAADGTYTISDVPPGTSGSMTCTKAGYSWTAITVAAMSGNLTSQNYTNAWWAAAGSAASIVTAYRCIGAASYAASKINVANPGINDAVEGNGAMTWDASYGWARSAGKYMMLTFHPGITWTFLVRFTEYTGGFSAIYGISNADFSQLLEIAPAYGGVHAYFMGGSVGREVAPEITNGVLGVAGNQGYLNGSTSGGAITTGAVPDSEMYLFGLNRVGTGITNPPTTCKVQAFAAWNTTLNGTQMAALSAAMAALTNP